MNKSPNTPPALVLLVTTIGAFANAFSGSSVNVALPMIGTEFGLGGVALNWVVTAFLLAASCLMMPMGRLGDLWGRQRVFLIGMIVYGAGSLLAALSLNSVWLIAARFVTGLGGSMIFGTATAFLVAAHPTTDRGRVLGINTAAVYFGLSAGPPLGGLFVEAFGWRMLFGLHFLLALVTVVVTLGWLRDNDKADAKGKFDFVGSVLFATGLSLLLVGVSDLPGALGTGLCVAGTVVLVVFWIVESRTTAPILPVTLLTKNRVFAFSNLAALLSYSATASIAFFVSLYLEVARGMSPATAGLILLTQPVLQAFVSPITGRLSDKVSPGLLASVGMGLTAAGLAALTFVDATTPLWWVLSALVLLGFGFGIFSSPNTNSIMGAVDRSMLGMASATVSTMRGLGQMFSMALALVLLAILLGTNPVGPATVDGFLTAQHWAFGLSAVLCALGIVASMARGPHRA